MPPFSHGRTKRPKTKYKKCAHCKRRLLSQFIEWHPGIEEWQCSNFADCDSAQDRRELKSMPSKYVLIDYTNWLGRRKERKIAPASMRFGTSDFHKEPQWLLFAIDLETGKEREFAMKDIHSWKPLSGR